MTQQTIVAVYDKPAHAEHAVADLLQAGIAESAIERHAQDGSTSGTSTAMVARPTEHEGFWASLFGGPSDHDEAVYDRSIEGGATVLSVKVAEEHVGAVSDILERHYPVDMDERAGTYGLVQPAAGRAAVPGGPVADDVAAKDGGTLTLSEEALTVGKRVVNHGTTRVRRFVVSSPVEERVTLRDERVTLERHPVADGRAVPTGAFTDRSIEMTETAEEAVVSKTARVIEEIRLKKEATDRVETVHDTVRREDVEVVQVPGGESARTAGKTVV